MGVIGYDCSHFEVVSFCITR